MIPEERPHPDWIEYEILDSGDCSYCGRPAELIELPDGDTTLSNDCDFCDAFNDDLLTYGVQIVTVESGETVQLPKSDRF